MDKFPIKESDAWEEYLRRRSGGQAASALVAQGSHQQLSAEAALSLSDKRRRLVDEYIDECKRSGIELKRKDIWSGWLNHKDDTQFHAWQRGDMEDREKTSRRMAELFRTKPHLNPPPPQVAAVSAISTLIRTCEPGG
jgi:hypothetical protein